jgi:uncharacterized integral membrane protein (TIGR00698 family)
MVAARKNTVMISRIAFVFGLIACCTPVASPLIALLAGIIVGHFFGNPFKTFSQKSSTVLLQISVVGLGFGIDAQRALEAGCDGFLFTVISITLTLMLGLIAGRAFGVEKKISHLISCGTAICGGSAIAIVSPVVKADRDQSSIALATVFMLNAAALLTFPLLGKTFHLSQHQFGLWAAIAIHDTSAVVGAAANYGNEALQIATTVKLARALWIIPVALTTALAFKSSDRRIKVPWFIGFFVVAVLINTCVPAATEVSPYLMSTAKSGMIVTLFLIGSGMSRTALQSVGLKPLLQGALLWVVISAASLVAILNLVK